jgi:hypothetical protein
MHGGEHIIFGLNVYEKEKSIMNQPDQSQQPDQPQRPELTEFERRQVAYMEQIRRTRGNAERPVSGGSLANPSLDWNANGFFRPQNAETLPYSGSQAPEQGSSNIAGLHAGLMNRQQSSNPGLRSPMPMPNPGPPEPPSDLDRANARKAAWHSGAYGINHTSAADAVRHETGHNSGSKQ